MRIDIAQIPYSEIAPHSILVVRGSDEELALVIPEIRKRVDPSVAFQRMNEDTEVLCISEENMNAAGWYRTKASETATVAPSS